MVEVEAGVSNDPVNLDLAMAVASAASCKKTPGAEMAKDVTVTPLFNTMLQSAQNRGHM